jgi:hypothetical protein
MLSTAQLKVLIHRIEARIPKKITEYYQDMEHRKLIAIKYGAKKAFLDSEKLKFAVIDPFNGKYQCTLITLAIFKALWNMHRPTKKPKKYYESMFLEAKNLYKEIGCQDILEEMMNLPNNFNIDELK